MPTNHPHPTDEDLLLLEDGELSSLHAWRLRRHLAGCPACRNRVHTFQRTMAEVIAIDQPTRPIESKATPRALLKARLDAEHRLNPTPRPAGTLRTSLSLAAVFLAGIASWLLYAHARNTYREPTETLAEQRQEPNLYLTPGATRSVSLDEICSQDATADQDPELTPTQQEAVYREYNVNERPARKYQVDYLISPQLGGTSDLHNLWPQPYGTTRWNAKAKDALETRLHQMVCRREVDLPWAQHEIATDWIAAYRRVFHTENPL